MNKARPRFTNREIDAAIQALIMFTAGAMDDAGLYEDNPEDCKI